MIEFSKNLINIRNSYNMTKRTLADKLNVSISTIENWENDKSLPSLINLYKLCKLLNCSSDKILGVDSFKG